MKVDRIRSLSATRLLTSLQPLAVSTSGPPIQPETKTEEPKKKEIFYKVAFEYKADNNDELNLIVGDVIKV